MDQPLPPLRDRQRFPWMTWTDWLGIKAFFMGLIWPPCWLLWLANPALWYGLFLLQKDGGRVPPC